jgi:RNA polymerase sigma factor (TIGR02999 family)
MPQDPDTPGDITALLQRWKLGDTGALSNLAALTYSDLHAIAAGYLRHESANHTLQATGLVNELYLRLIRQNNLQLTDRRHFFAFAAMMMRRILCDYARQARTVKRPGGQSTRIPFTPTSPGWTRRARTCSLSIAPSTNWNPLTSARYGWWNSDISWAAPAKRPPN